LADPAELRLPSFASGSQKIGDFLGVALQVQQHEVLFARFSRSRGLLIPCDFKKHFLKKGSILLTRGYFLQDLYLLIAMPDFELHFVGLTAGPDPLRRRERKKKDLLTGPG